MALSPCRYCARIRKQAAGYRARPGRHGGDAGFPRCDWHWRYDCAVCGQARHYHGTAFCSREERYFCIHCAPEHRAPARAFWGWAYYYRMRCPWRAEWHAALDRLEYEGRHPWQRSRTWARERRGMSRSETIDPMWAFRIEPIEAVTEEVSRRSWDAAAEWWSSKSSPRGDVNREWVIDPALFRILGDVRGKRILDAGCGAGYLARLLVSQGAKVDGVDHSSQLLGRAREEETEDGQGIEYHEADLADMPAFRDGTFDFVVSNVVVQDIVRYREAFQEFHRVLRPGGRFVFSVTHPCFERPVPGSWLREPPDAERVEEWRGLLVDGYYRRAAIWWGSVGEPGMVGFHRTLEDYVCALRDAGFAIARMDEPAPSPAALEHAYRAFADYLRAPLFLIIEAIRLDV